MILKRVLFPLWFSTGFTLSKLTSINNSVSLLHKTNNHVHLLTTRYLTMSTTTTTANTDDRSQQSCDEEKILDTTNENSQSTTNDFYTITPMKIFGAEITNIDLNEANLSESLISTIRSDIHKHQLIVVRNQGINNNNTLTPQKHVCYSYLYILSTNPSIHIHSFNFFIVFI